MVIESWEMQQERWGPSTELIITIGTMIIRTLWSLLLHGFYVAAVTPMAPMQASSTSVVALVLPALPSVRVSSYLQNNKNTRILSLVFFSYLS